MKRLILASILFCTPVSAATFAEGVSMGSWMAFCQAHRYNDYKDPGLARHMTMSAYAEMAEEDQAFARDMFPECTPNQ